jgi:hypothetical protein
MNNDIDQEIKRNYYTVQCNSFNIYLIFNKQIKENVLPSSLTHLTFFKYNKQIKENVLHSSLTHLTFSFF